MMNEHNATNAIDHSERLTQEPPQEAKTEPKIALVEDSEEEDYGTIEMESVDENDFEEEKEDSFPKKEIKVKEEEVIQQLQAAEKSSAVRLGKRNAQQTKSSEEEEYCFGDYFNDSFDRAPDKILRQIDNFVDPKKKKTV